MTLLINLKQLMFKNKVQDFPKLQICIADCVLISKRIDDCLNG